VPAKKLTYALTKIRIQNYKSITDLVIESQKDKPVIICGANNVGKTNFLNALRLFFIPDNFAPDEDIAFHKNKGSGGGSNKVVITITFRNNNDCYVIKREFKKSSNAQNTVVTTGSKNKKN